MPRKGRVSLEEKVEIVRRCIAGELSIYAARQLVGVGGTTVRRWIARYEAEGSEGFLSQDRNRVYSPELKQRAVDEYLSCAGSLIDIIKKYKIKNDYQLRTWINIDTDYIPAPNIMRRPNTASPKHRYNPSTVAEMAAKGIIT